MDGAEFTFCTVQTNDEKDSLAGFPSFTYKFRHIAPARALLVFKDFVRA